MVFTFLNLKLLRRFYILSGFCGNVLVLICSLSYESKRAKMDSQAKEFTAFETLRTFHLKFIGCLPFQNLPNWCQKLLFITIYIVLVSNAISIWYHLLFEATNFAEYVETTFGGTVGALILSQYCLFNWHKTEISQLLNKMDQIIARSIGKIQLFNSLFYKLVINFR